MPLVRSESRGFLEEALVGLSDLTLVRDREVEHAEERLARLSIPPVCLPAALVHEPARCGQHRYSVCVRDTRYCYGRRGTDVRSHPSFSLDAHIIWAGIAECTHVRRAGRKILAVFEGGFHCTSLGAVEWSESETFDQIFTEDMYQELNEEVGVEKDDVEVILPLSLCREFLRGGKPQIFFAGLTTLSENELAKKRRKALQRQKALPDKVEIKKTDN